MTHTIVKLWDWQRFVIPSINMLRENFVNYSLIDQSQWSRVEFWISYEADIDVVKELAIKLGKTSPYAKQNTEINFGVMDMTSENIKSWLVGLTEQLVVF